MSWLKDTICPRMEAGEVSAMYIGAMIRDAPTPRPPTIRAMTSKRKLGAMAEPMAEMA